MQKEAFKEDERDQRADNNRLDLNARLDFVVEEFPLPSLPHWSPT
jgi:hypothetical protein